MKKIICIYSFFSDVLHVKQAEVQPAETHPLYLCQFVFYGCVFVNIFILTGKYTSVFAYVLIKVELYNVFFFLNLRLNQNTFVFTLPYYFIDFLN